MRDTGDLVTEKNGFIYYLCRRDLQVKRFGHRIHLSALQHQMEQLLPAKVKVL
jgi:hypothetical protein